MSADRLRVLVLEPYYGGSHRAVLDGLLARLDFDYDLLTLPARKWKWRMRGAAITLAEEARALHASGVRWDLVYASTFINLAEFYGIAGDAIAGVPSIVYFHENQLVYPNRHESEWDYQFPLTNITSALSATRCLFNTEWTKDTFLGEIPGFLKRFPDHHPRGVAQLIAPKCQVIAPPFDPAEFDHALGQGGVAAASRGSVTRIVWPHRWEHDKDPDAFFGAVAQLAAEGLDFEVAVAGQSFRDVPDSISTAQAVLGNRLIHVGEPDGRAAYAELLAGADVAVSTARNEFFGLAMIESAYAGCYPLVPDRLAYPEIYRAEMRYASSDQLVARLRSFVLDRPEPGQGRALAEEYTFERLLPAYREAFRAVAMRGSSAGAR